MHRLVTDRRSQLLGESMSVTCELRSFLVNVQKCLLAFVERLLAVS